MNQRRQKGLNLKQLQAHKAKLERRLDNIKRELVIAIQAEEFLIKKLEETKQEPYVKEK